MPQAVMHVLLAIIAVDIYRDYIITDKKTIPLSFVLVGGIAGLLPDLDIPVYWFVKYVLGFDVTFFHRTFTHSLFFPLLFLLLAVGYVFVNKKVATVLGIITFGITFHILLDLLFAGYVMPLYPFSTVQVGLNLIGRFSIEALPEGIDAVILILWLIHEEYRHKISDFI